MATFTADVATSLRASGHHVAVAALIDADELARDEVTHGLVRTCGASARKVAAAFSADVDVVLIQHEFGIFGGVDGVQLHELTDYLNVPYVLTLHTVPGRYTASQRAALAAPLERCCDGVVVLRRGRRARRRAVSRRPGTLSCGSSRRTT